MAERTILKTRVTSIEFASPITKEADLATAIWEKQPLTLRDDEVLISENEPEEKLIYSHENDSPEIYDLTGGGLTISGSFINANYEQMAELLGGEIKGTGDDAMFMRKGNKTVIEKAIRFILKDGSTVIVPCAKGYVLLNLNAGVDGLLKHPFSFKAMAQTDFNYDIIIQ